MQVGTVDPTGMPEAARGWGLRVLPGGERARVLVAADAERTLANLRSTAVVAVTGVSVETLESVQVKGRATLVEPAGAEDQERADRYVDAVLAELERVEGTPRERTHRLVPAGFAAFEMELESVFDQTPGPLAGRRLAPTADA
jgi:hypothetical protein